MTDSLASKIIDAVIDLDSGLIDDTIRATEQMASGQFILRETSDRVLLVGVPNLSLETQLAWLGGIRISDWPREALQTQRFAIVSSRLTRKLGQHTHWFDALRTIACQLNPDEQAIITSEGTTADRFVKRLNNLFGLSVFAVSFDHKVQDFESETDADPTEIRFSQPLRLPASNKVPDPKADRFLITLAHQVRALDVKSNSQTSELLRLRLNDASFPAATVHVNSAADSAQELAENSAVLRVFLRESAADETRDTAATAAVLTTPPFDDYLLHWTRSPDGPWPDEDPDDYLDALILGVESKDRTAFAALLRIIETQKLVASSHLIRGGHKVVCFTDTPVETLPDRRIYRRHLHRWDFEPYGIAIRKSAIPAAKPVQYGTAEDFSDMPPADQPFFQLASETSEWRNEAEWRVFGDIDLGAIDASDVFIFVPTEKEAQQISQQLGWQPVMINGT